MANTFKVLFRGAAATTNANLYTVPALTTVLVNSIVVANTSNATQTYNIFFNGISIATLVPIPAYDSIILEPKQVISTTNVISGFASATSVNFHISGLEIT